MLVGPFDAATWANLRFGRRALGGILADHELEG
jgi:hypothetical protein